MTLRTTTRKRLYTSLMGGTALALAILLVGCSGQSYSCGDASGNHCYGIVTWSGSPTGFSLQMTPAPLTSGDIGIDDEAWLVQNFVPACPGGACWVETGEDNTNPTYANGYGSTIYFWASGTADAGFMFYYLGDVPKSDYGNWVQSRSEPGFENAFHVGRYHLQARLGREVVYRQACTDNPMTPNTVIEGQELAGTNDAQAPIVFFTHNAEIKGSKKTDRTSDGTVCKGHSPACPGAPPNAGWFGNETPSKSPNGGLFFTDCC